MIGEDVDLDTRERTRDGSDRSRLAPIVGSILISVNQPAGIVTNASTATTADKVRRSQVGADLLGRGPEIEYATLLVGQDGTIGDENAIDSDTLTGIRQVYGVVVDSRVVRILETVKIPVYLSWISTHVGLFRSMDLRESSA